MGQFRGLRRGRPFWLLLAAHALLACAAQVDGQYKGEPIATMHGVVASSSKLKSDTDVSAAIVWMYFGETDKEPRYTGERVAVEDHFPASFSLKLYGSPAPAAEIKTVLDYCVEGPGEVNPVDPDGRCKGPLIPAGTGVGVWAGYLAAIDSSASRGEISRDDIRGIDVDHELFYFDHDYTPSDDPVPSKATARQLAQHFDFVAYDGPYKTGYHLRKFNPEYRAWAQQGRECKWKDLCVHWTPADASLQDYDDWDFQRCTQRFPDNPTCSAYSEATDGEPAASVECRERYESSVGPHACTSGTGLPLFEQNQKGLADPITIQLGLGFWDAGP